MMREILTALLLIGGGLSYAQFQGTLAGFTDTGTTTGHFEAEVTENSTHDPWHAYEDVDDDDLYTDGVDIKIPDEEILDGTYTVQKAQHGLVIPKSVGPVDVTGPIRFEAGKQAHLTVEVRLTSTAATTLTAGTDAILSGTVVEAGLDITVQAGAGAILDEAFLRTDDGQITIDAKDGVDALKADLEASGPITVQAKQGNIGLVRASALTDGSFTATTRQGTVNADRATVNASGPLELTSGADVRVKRASLETTDDIVLTAGSPNEAIFVQDARFDDANDVAQAAPGQVEIVGTPAEGSIDHQG